MEKIGHDKFMRTDMWMMRQKELILKKKHCAVCGRKKNLMLFPMILVPNPSTLERENLRVLCGECYRLTNRMIENGSLQFRNTKHRHRWAMISWYVRKRQQELRAGLSK